mmetsp:Transcript_22832/g.31208  ORF Transcript_22832/g.31208 Transcript_22832/m.31208 type:complete len:80 (+) Transcript_22832:172-411(+)
MKMDHHCVAINNCVGLHNYGLFVKVVIYQGLYCIGSFICAWITNANSEVWKASGDDLRWIRELCYITTKLIPAGNIFRL